MVSFSCDGCNETLKKQKVAWHNCGSSSVSCIDCSVTFYGDDYAKHTSCISEAQKYEKSLYRGKKPNGKKRQLQQPSAENPAKKQSTESKDDQNQTNDQISAEISNDARKDLIKSSVEQQNGISSKKIHMTQQEVKKSTQIKKQKKKSEKTKKKEKGNKKEIDTVAESKQKPSKKDDKQANIENAQEKAAVGSSEANNMDSNKQESIPNDRDMLKRILTEVLSENTKSSLSLGHVRKMAKKRGRGCGISFDDDLFYSCLNDMGASIGLTLIK